MYSNVELLYFLTMSFGLHVHLHLHLILISSPGASSPSDKHRDHNDGQPWCNQPRLICEVADSTRPTYLLTIHHKTKIPTLLSNPMPKTFIIAVTGDVMLGRLIDQLMPEHNQSPTTHHQPKNSKTHTQASNKRPLPHHGPQPSPCSPPTTYPSSTLKQQ
jgi:hypothetical protein